MKVFRLLVLLGGTHSWVDHRCHEHGRDDHQPAVHQLKTSVGVAIIAALLIGVIVGAGLVLVSVVIPLYSQLRRASKSAAATPAPVASPQSFDGR